MRKFVAFHAIESALAFFGGGVASAQEYTGTTVPGAGVDSHGEEAGDKASEAVASAGRLPTTGSETLPIAQTGIVLVAAGGLALTFVRRSASVRAQSDS